MNTYSYAQYISRHTIMSYELLSIGVKESKDGQVVGLTRTEGGTPVELSV